MRRRSRRIRRRFCAGANLEPDRFLIGAGKTLPGAPSKPDQRRPQRASEPGECFGSGPRARISLPRPRE